MAGLRVFVSSTCYDLGAVRGHIRVFIQSFGYEPIMSDYHDLLYDPRLHTHTSCVEEVSSCDMVLLLVGSRYGGASVPESYSKIDFERVYKESKSVDSLKSKEDISITQLEILKAIEEDIPVFAFIDERVWHDHALYEKNKHKDILPQISFPSIEKPETAKFIFEFINFLRHRNRGNGLFQFSKIQDIEDVLRRQWSALFQKLLNEQRRKTDEAKRLNALTEQFEDLKTAILSSIGPSNQREIAKGVVRYRRLLDFIRAIGIQKDDFVIRETHTWTDLLRHASINETVYFNRLPEEIQINIIRETPITPRVMLIKKDKTYFSLRISENALKKIELDWDEFSRLKPDVKEVIFDALAELNEDHHVVFYIDTPFDSSPSVEQASPKRFITSHYRQTGLNELPDEAWVSPHK